MNFNEIQKLATEMANEIVNAGVTSYFDVEDLDRHIDNALLNIGDVEDSQVEIIRIECRKDLSIE